MGGENNRYVSVSIENKTAVITLNNPPVNALTPELLTDLSAASSSLSLDDTAVVILTGNEPHCFCAGANIKAFEANKAEYNQEYFDKIYATLKQVESCPVPVIAAVNGIAMGAGLELSLCADLRVVDEKARLSAKGVEMGLVFGTQRLPRLIGYGRAGDMLYTAKIIGAPEALEYGLAQYIAPAGQSLEIAKTIAQTIESKSLLAVRGVKQALRAGQGLNLDGALEQERQQLFAMLTTQDFKQRVEDFVKAREK